ncbi:MAG TPA: YbaB/EbfC family nucleoid-associated protein [Pseudonocardiaceae bacterium]|nr:YbaB/EbfC family nucleoid-associated protein [Pseudonocardiaceae bacterium]
MDPARWLADYNKQLANTAATAQAAGAELGNVTGHARSGRGEVEVVVTATGALADLRLTPGARKLEAEQLAALILATAREAQRLAGARTLEIMSGYLGEGPALDAVRQNLPATGPIRVDEPSDDDYFAATPGVIQ